MRQVIMVSIFCIISAVCNALTFYYVNGINGSDSYDGLAPVYDGVHGPKKTIQAGVTAASAGDYVNLADGTYSGTGNRNISFGGKSITLRAIGNANTTIIDCGNSARFCSISSSESATVIEGLRIRNGYYGTSGGAIYCSSSSPTIRYCVFESNWCVNHGGAIYCWSASPTILGCTFEGNSCGITGGAIACYNNSNANISDCIFSNNESDNDAGGIMCGNSQVIISDCEFLSNTAADIGGAIYCNTGPPKILSCKILNNTALFGGGGIACENSAAKIENCVIAGNFGGFYGGAMELFSGSNPSVTNCTIADNTAINEGGGIDCYNASPSIMNTILWDNEPEQIYVSTGTPTVYYCDIKGGWTGYGTHNINTDPKFIYTGNSDYRLRPLSPCIDAGNRTGAPSQDILGRPRHDDPMTTNTGGGIPNYYDIGAYEFKAYFVNTETGSETYNGLYPNNIGGSNGPKKTIQEGIDVAIDGDTVYVAYGNYRGIETGNRNIDLRGKAIFLHGAGGAEDTIINVNFYGGGFVCDSMEGSDTVIEGFTVLEGMSTFYGGVYCYYYSNPTFMNCRFVECRSQSNGGGVSLQAYCNPKFINCDFDRNRAEQNGGGLYCTYYCNPEIIGCTFKDNTARIFGAAIECSTNSNAVISDCRIFNNVVEGTSDHYGGGGISCSFDSNGTISDCWIVRNKAQSGAGGGIKCFSSSPTITNCRIIDNTAGIYGGGIYWSASLSTATNCLVVGNTSGKYGGGLYSYSSNLTVTNCTIANNSADFMGGGMYNWDAFSHGPTITNSIFWGDSPSEITGYMPITTLNYCGIQGGWTGNGSNNTTTNPLFVRQGYRNSDGIWIMGDYHLIYNSPCIDNGNNAAPSRPLIDLDGFARIQTGRTAQVVDRGAYEFGTFVPIWSISVSGSDIQIIWCSSGLPGKKYDILYCYQNIAEPKNWYILKYGIPSGGAYTTYTDTELGSSKYRFYMITESATSLSE